jgi:hypothetical protein
VNRNAAPESVREPLLVLSEVEKMDSKARWVYRSIRPYVKGRTFGGRSREIQQAVNAVKGPRPRGSLAKVKRWNYRNGRFWNDPVGRVARFRRAWG